VVAEAPQLAAPQALSPGATAGWGLAILVVTGLIHGLVATAIAGGAVGLRDDGLIFSVGIVASALVGGTFLLWVLRGRSPREYLALVRPRGSALAAALAFAVVTAAALDGVSTLLGRPLVPDAWYATFHAARLLPLLLFALVVVAPVYEEMYFRGFLHRGLAVSRLGPAGAIAVIALLFSLVHFPEDAWSFTQGFATGALLGVVRHHSGSIVPCMLVHALLNAKVMLQLALGEPAA
jgi:membrane protease YdiL (CAAX protease family)